MSSNPDPHADLHEECNRRIVDLVGRLLKDGPKSMTRYTVVRIDEHGHRHHLNIRDVYEGFQNFTGGVGYPGQTMIIVS